MSNHTKTPWRTGGEQNPTIIYDGDGWAVASTAVVHVRKNAKYEADANAAFIVRACNAHDELVAALDWALSQIGDDLDLDHQRAFDGAIAALAKARGES